MLPNPLFAVIDANILIGLCARELDKYDKIMLELSAYLTQQRRMFAPQVIVMEVLYVLCNKNKSGALTDAEHSIALKEFFDIMELVEAQTGGDFALAKRAEEIRQGRGCSHSADGLYLALAEELSTLGAVELLTFDQGQAAQATAILPQITVKLLVP